MKDLKTITKSLRAAVDGGEQGKIAEDVSALERLASDHRVHGKAEKAVAENAVPSPIIPEIAQEMDWTIPGDVLRKNEWLGLQAYWAKQLQERPTEDLLAIYKELTVNFRDALFDLRYLGSSGDTVSWLDRKRIAVTIALGLKLTNETDRLAESEFERHCEEADSVADPFTSPCKEATCQ